MHVSQTKPNILFLASWFPSRNDPTSGIFVRRHAQALASTGKYQVDIAFCHNSGDENKPWEIDYKEEDGIRTAICYYPKGNNPWQKTYRYLKAYKMAIDHLNAKPDLIVCNVVWRAGLLALTQKYFNKIPYIIIEHWSGYMPDDGRYRGIFLKFWSKKIVGASQKVLTISQQMESLMRDTHGLSAHYGRIANVVDPVFKLNGKILKNNSKFQFLHISNFVPEKRVGGLLSVFRQLVQENSKVKLILGGDGPLRKELLEQYQDLIDSEHLEYKGIISPIRVADLMQESDAFVLFSQFEGQPCVMLESWSMGLPVIATPVGGIPEVFHPENGILLKDLSEEALLQAMRNMAEAKISFNIQALSKQAARLYSSEAVGQALAIHIDEVLSREVC